MSEAKHVNFILSNWTYQEYNQFIELYNNRKFREAGYLAEKVVADWSAFDIVPDTEHPIDNLSFEDSAAVLLAIQHKTIEYVESLDVEKDVIIDMTKWKWYDFNHFTELVATGKIDAAVDMMRDVARLKRGNPKANEPLNAIQGICMMQALTNRIRRVFSGGN